MLVKGLIIISLFAFASCQDINKTNCLDKLVKWCEDMRYPQQGAGMSMLSIAYQNSSGDYFRVLCTSDFEGTNCTRNSQPWFACVPVSDSNNTFTYKGQSPQVNATDDEICDTYDKAFNDLFVQNLSYDNTTMKEEMDKSFEAFFDQMAMMQEQIDQLRRWFETFMIGRDSLFAFGDTDYYYDYADNSTIPPAKPTKQIETE